MKCDATTSGGYQCRKDAEYRITCSQPCRCEWSACSRHLAQMIDYAADGKAFVEIEAMGKKAR